jgi:hypothetical protein
VVTKIKLCGGKVIDELVGSNRGKVRLISRAERKRYGEAKKMDQDLGQNESPL